VASLPPKIDRFGGRNVEDIFGGKSIASAYLESTIIYDPSTEQAPSRG